MISTMSSNYTCAYFFWSTDNRRDEWTNERKDQIDFFFMISKKTHSLTGKFVHIWIQLTQNVFEHDYPRYNQPKKILNISKIYNRESFYVHFILIWVQSDGTRRLAQVPEAIVPGYFCNAIFNFKIPDYNFNYSEQNKKNAKKFSRYFLKIVFDIKHNILECIHHVKWFSGQTSI